MKLNRRDFLKGLGLTLTTIPFLRKLPEPPTPEPEPESISLQEEYNERVEELADDQLNQALEPVDWTMGYDVGKHSCCFEWTGLPAWKVWPSGQGPYAYLHDRDMGDLCRLYCRALETKCDKWELPLLVPELLEYLETVDSDRYAVSATGWWTRFRRTPSGRWVGFTPYGHRVLEPADQQAIAVTSAAGFRSGDRLVLHTTHGPVEGPVVSDVAPGTLFVSLESPGRPET